MIKKCILFSAFLMGGFTGVFAVKISSVAELIEQIGSNKTLELEPGSYNLTKVAEAYNPHIEWVNNHDGYEPIISNVNNLSIVGKGNTQILIEPRYAWVMNFVNCSNLRFSNLIFGHTEAGYCMGGVLNFESCSNVAIEKCYLYGSGTVGIMANKCDNLSLDECEIYECTYGLAYLYNSNNIRFEKTTFRNTGEFDLVEIMSCNSVTFKSCWFTDNYNGKFLPHFFTIDANLWNNNGSVTSSSAIQIEKCTFMNNKVQKFANDESKISLKGNKFKNNTFSTPGK